MHFHRLEGGEAGGLGVPLGNENLPKQYLIPYHLASSMLIMPVFALVSMLVSVISPD